MCKFLSMKLSAASMYCDLNMAEIDDTQTEKKCRSRQFASLSSPPVPSFFLSIQLLLSSVPNLCSQNMNPLGSKARRFSESLLPSASVVFIRFVSSWTKDVVPPDHTVHAFKAGREEVFKYYGTLREFHKPIRDPKCKYEPPRELTAYDAYNVKALMMPNDDIHFIFASHGVEIVPLFQPKTNALLTRWMKPTSPRNRSEGDSVEGDSVEGDSAEGDSVEGDSAEGDSAESDKRYFKFNVDASISDRQCIYAWVLRNSEGMPLVLVGRKLMWTDYMHKKKSDSTKGNELYKKNSIKSEVAALCRCVIEGVPELANRDYKGIVIESDNEMAVNHLKARKSHFGLADLIEKAGKLLDDEEAKGVEVIVRKIPRESNRLADYIASNWTYYGDLNGRRDVRKDGVRDDVFWAIVVADMSGFARLHFPPKDNPRGKPNSNRQGKSKMSKI